MWTYLKVITTILVLGIIFGGGYLAYRYYQSSPDVLRQYMQDGHSVAATRCVLPGAGSFSATVQELVIYVDGENLRSDWIQSEFGRTEKIHSISNDNGINYYVWGGNGDNPLIFSKEQMLKDGGINSFSSVIGATCTPWWLPDDSIFHVPDTLTFTPYSG